MVKFSGQLEKFDDKGEKTGWTYLFIPAAVSQKINPGIRKSYRVKGSINNKPVEGISLMPVGNGHFILVFNAGLRKLTGKEAGDSISVQLETDLSPRKLDEDFLMCLQDDSIAMKHFKSLTPSHQHYFSWWIASAKTENTKSKRIAMALNALSRNLGFPDMMRERKAYRESLK